VHVSLKVKQYLVNANLQLGAVELGELIERGEVDEGKEEEMEDAVGISSVGCSCSV